MCKENLKTQATKTEGEGAPVSPQWLACNLPQRFMYQCDVAQPWVTGYHGSAVMDAVTAMLASQKYIFLLGSGLLKVRPLLHVSGSLSAPRPCCGAMVVVGHPSRMLWCHAIWTRFLHYHRPNKSLCKSVSILLYQQTMAYEIPKGHGLRLRACRSEQQMASNCLFSPRPGAIDLCPEQRGSLNLDIQGVGPFNRQLLPQLWVFQGS